MKTITLQTAVQLTIRALLEIGITFSAYQVTQIVRASVDKDYHLSDVSVTAFKFDDDLDDEVEHTVIEHNTIKALVTELYENELFKANIEYKNDGKNAYKAYAPIPNNIGLPTPTSTSVPIPSTTPDWYDKVLPYLERKGGATAKEIQSALKIKGVTCEDILDALGIIPNALAPSKTFVFLSN
jgi:stalled ribosome alternative rescue factor ArfA